MSRSYRKSPCSGVTCAESEKEFKQMSSRKVRRVAKQKVKNVLLDTSVADEMVLPRKSSELTETWEGPKDGRVWWDNSGYGGNETALIRHAEEWYKKLMRK